MLRELGIDERNCGALKLLPLVYVAWADGEPSEAEPMNLKVGSKWRKSETEVIGVSKITIAGRSWKCLKVDGLSQESRVYAEW